MLRGRAPVRLRVPPYLTRPPRQVLLAPQLQLKVLVRQEEAESHRVGVIDAAQWPAGASEQRQRTRYFGQRCACDRARVCSENKKNRPPEKVLVLDTAVEPCSNADSIAAFELPGLTHSLQAPHARLPTSVRPPPTPSLNSWLRNPNVLAIVTS